MKVLPDPTDTHVGNRVRMRRMMLGMSQTELADAIGVTFQQVQKYEKGKDRVSASRLQQMSTVSRFSSKAYRAMPTDRKESMNPSPR